MSKHSQIVLVFAVLASIMVLVAACGVPPVDENVTEPEEQVGSVVQEPTPPPTCPPMGAKADKVAVSDNDASHPTDGSSIEVFDETYCETDPGVDPWCDTEDLDIKYYPLTNLSTSTCPFDQCLVAVDLEPDSIKCPLSKNPQTTNYPDGTKPELSIDLDQHKPKYKQPEECAGTVKCYAFYYWSGSKWSWVGWAMAKQIGSEWYAVGRIYHLSVYALVEVPDATPVADPRTMGMVVASEFIEDDQGNLAVGVINFEDSLGELDQGGEHRILQFSRVDPGSPEGELPPDCMALPSIAEQFTCLFPIDTLLELELLGDGQAVLRALEAGYGIEFSVSDVQIY